MSEYVSFSIDVVCSDDFYSLPIAVRALYFHLCIHANNNGMLNNAKAISRSIDIDFSEMSWLIEKGYVKKMDDGYYKIVHYLENSGQGELHKKRASYSYRKWRNSVIERDGWTCQLCGGRKNLVAHHIVPFSENEELQTVLSNGITICYLCHRKIHKGVLECPT